MSRNVRDPDFINQITAVGGVTDHIHAHELMESFLQVEHTDLQHVFDNAPIALTFIEASIENIKNAFNALPTPFERTLYIANLRRLESNLERKQMRHSQTSTQPNQAGFGGGGILSDEDRQNHTLLANTSASMITLVRDSLIPALQAAPAPAPINAPVLPNAPTHVFQVGDVDQLQWILSPQVKGTIAHAAFDHFFRDYISRPGVLAQINALYTQMRSAVRATPQRDAQSNLLPCPLIDTPLIDLGIILGDRSPLPTEKNKLNPLYSQIRGIWQRYESACDMNDDDGVYTDTVTTNVTLTNSSNQALFTPGGYVHTDASVPNPINSVLDRSRGMQCTYVDDQGRDCKRFFTTDPATGDYQLVGGQVQFDAEAFQREYPDAKSITITRPMVVSGNFTDSGVTIPFANIKTSFVDTIKFSKLNVLTRTGIIQTFFAGRDRSNFKTALLSKTQELTTHLNTILRTTYGDDDGEHILAALGDNVPTPNLTFDTINEGIIYGTTQVTVLDRIVTAICSKKLADCRTEDEFHAIIQGFKSNPDSLLTNLKDVPRGVFGDLRTMVDARIAAVPPGNVLAPGFVARLGVVDVAGVLGTANTSLPHAPSNYLDFPVISRVSRKRKDFGRTKNLSKAENMRDVSKRVEFVETRDIEPYRFLMGIGDNHGEGVEETVSLKGSGHTFSNIKTKISILSPSLIDYDFTIPAQGGVPEFVFDGNRGTPDDIRAQLDTECAGRDRKLVHNSKLYFEEELLKRLEAQNGDISARFDAANVFTVSTNAKGIIELNHRNTTVNPHALTTYTADACRDATESDEFVTLVRRVMDGHVQTARDLLLNGETDKYAALADFPTLSEIENANGKVPDDYPLEREKTKDFGEVTVKVGYKLNEQGKYKLYVEDSRGVEEFDSIGEAVLSDKNRFIGLDLMHWFHEKLLDHFLANRKTLPQDRAYVVEDPITGVYYGIYQVGTKIHYGQVEDGIVGYPQESLTGEQERKNVITDPKRRCLMLRMPVTFKKGSDDLAKKTICGRKDLFYSLMFGAMSTSKPGIKEKEFVAEQNKKGAEEKADLMKGLGDLSNLATLWNIGKEAFSKASKK